MLIYPDGPRPAGRIFCIGRNYAEHIREMKTRRPTEPIVFIKPPTCIVPPEMTVTLPRDQGSIHHELEMVVALGCTARNIPAGEALACVDCVSLGLDLTLRDLQARLKAAGEPWERCKSFEQSAPLGRFVKWHGQFDLQSVTMRCLVNGKLRQQGNTKDMLFPIAELIAFLSCHWKLQSGDIIFTGTPSGVGPLLPGDEVVIESDETGRFVWHMG